MKLGVICDGISRDFEHALKVMDEFGLEYAELQFIWDHEIGDHDASDMAKIKELLKTVSETCFLSFSSYFCWSHHGQSAWRSRSYPPYGSVKAGNRYGTSASLAFGSHYDL
jgi:hypothetical protein